MPIPAAIPYVPDFNNLHLESVIGFVLGVLFAVLFNAEGQAFLATTLGDRREGATDRFHFNAFLHLDILGTLAFLLGGFGWPRWIDIDAAKFEHPMLYRIIARLGGPLANLLMAGIGASIVTLVMSLMALDPVIFLGVVAVNVTVAVYNLIPIPPLALGNIWVELLPESLTEVKKWLLLAGPYIIIALLLCDRIFQLDIFSRYLNPLVVKVFNFTAG
jgi:Zn-dependent protease